MLSARTCCLCATLAVIPLLVSTLSTSIADQNTESAQQPTTMQHGMSNAELKAQIEALRATLDLVAPTYASLMPDFAERFHVMHRAGDTGDWAVASHELLEMERLMKVFDAIDEQKGAMLKGFMTVPMLQLRKIIEHGKHEPFVAALKEATASCNACHQAVGSEFINVTLDTSDALSIRHPHRFIESKASHTHTH